MQLELIENIKYLRKVSGMTQQDLSTALGIPRSTLGEYERGNTEPSLSLTIKIGQLFRTSLDSLLREKLYLDGIKVEQNEGLKTIAITLDINERPNIELVETRAEAGYLDGFTNPEFIRDLPKIHFPNLPRGTYRGFEIVGDSMLPVESGSIIICRYLERLVELKNDQTYVVITQKEGVVYKRVRLDKKSNELVLMSDNDSYLPYSIAAEEIKEIWQYYAHLSFSDSKRTFNAMLDERITTMQKQIGEIHQKVMA